MVEISEDITETLSYCPGVLLKHCYIRKKYARAQEAEGASAIPLGEQPKRPIPKGIAKAGLLAYLVVAKFIDHLPFSHQIEIFKRDHVWAIHKSTINDWFGACCTLLESLFRLYAKTCLIRTTTPKSLSSLWPLLWYSSNTGTTKKRHWKTDALQCHFSYPASFTASKKLRTSSSS